MSNPFDVQAADAVSAATGLFVMTSLALPHEVAALIKSHLGVGAQTLDGLMAQAADNADEIEILGDLSFEESEAAAMAQQASVVRLVNDILTQRINGRLFSTYWIGLRWHRKLTSKNDRTPTHVFL